MVYYMCITTLYVLSVMCVLMCIGIPHRASEETRVSTSPLIISGKIHLPFQLQIKYTDQDGSRCMRVSTFSKPVTSDKETAERSEFHCTIFCLSQAFFAESKDTDCSFVLSWKVSNIP